jgi:hypothetical protein
MNTANEGPSRAAVTRPTGGGAPPSRWRWLLVLAALGVVVLSAVGGRALARWFRDPGSPPEEAPLKAPPRLFAGWEKPDLVVLLSAQQHGYVLPCGCSDPQMGGLERRYNLMQLIRRKGWPLVAVDLGDVPQKRGIAHLPNLQGLIKYRYSMQALKIMGYTAVGVGEYEAHPSLFDTLGAWSLNEPKPAVLAGNLENIAEYPGWKTVELSDKVAGSDLRIGVAHSIGPSVLKNMKDPNVHFLGTRKALEAALNTPELKNADLRVLLYHGSIRPAEKGKMAEAEACARFYPQFPVILCLSEEDEPPANPTVVDLPGGQRSMIFSLGHKGKYVGALGVYRNGQAFRYRYQLIEVGPEYATPKNLLAGHPVLDIMEQYTKELRDQHYLEKYNQSKHILQVMNPVAGLAKPGKPTYVGSDTCKKCHVEQWKIWKKSDHSHAYQTLVSGGKNPRPPHNRQFDAECIVCHTVGFGYESGFVTKDRTPRLTDVGCESCHGPGSVHADNPNNQEWQQRMNIEWKATTPKEKELKIDRFCQRCHDIDNDVTWKHGAFTRKWIDGKIIHNNPHD